MRPPHCGGAVSSSAHLLRSREFGSLRSLQLRLPRRLLGVPPPRVVVASKGASCKRQRMRSLVALLLGLCCRMRAARAAGAGLASYQSGHHISGSQHLTESACSGLQPWLYLITCIPKGWRQKPARIAHAMCHRNLMPLDLVPLKTI